MAVCILGSQCGKSALKIEQQLGSERKDALVDMDFEVLNVLIKIHASRHMITLIDLR